MAQLINITSEALQATVRRLLPSQQGFGEDLQATNVVTPIIDLTPTAEGSVLDSDLARALAFGSQTAFSANDSTATIANSPGFYRITCGVTIRAVGAATADARFQMSDGLSTKTVLQFDTPAISGTTNVMSEYIDLTFFLAAGESLTAVSNNASVYMIGSSRQVATVTGDLVNPSGFVSQ